MRPIRTTARTLLASIFVLGGLEALRRPDALVDAAKPVADSLAPALGSVGLPTDPRSLVRLGGVTQVAGGLMLATGTADRAGSLLLAGALVPTTLAAHRYWEIDDPTERANQRIHFAKNLALLGGLLMAAVDTKGRPGLGWRAGHLAGHARSSVRRAAAATAREARRRAPH